MRTGCPQLWACMMRSSAAITRRSARPSWRRLSRGRARLRQLSPSPGTPRSRRGGWSSRKTVTSPACGAGAHCRTGEDAGYSGRWSPTAPGWPGSGGTGTCRSTLPRTAARSFSGWVLSSWPEQHRSETPGTRATEGRRRSGTTAAQPECVDSLAFSVSESVLPVEQEADPGEKQRAEDDQRDGPAGDAALGDLGVGAVVRVDDMRGRQAGYGNHPGPADGLVLAVVDLDRAGH